MTCHNCRHHEEVQRLTNICSRCTLSDKSASSGTVSLDRLPDGVLDGPHPAKLMARRAAGCEPVQFDPGVIDDLEAPGDTSELVRDNMVTLLACIAQIPYEHLTDLRRLIAVFDDLSEREFALVQHFLNGGTMTSYARANGLTKQAAWARCQSLFKHKPVLRSIANGLLGKLRGGRTAVHIDQQQYFNFGE